MSDEKLVSGVRMYVKMGTSQMQDYVYVKWREEKDTLRWKSGSVFGIMNSKIFTMVSVTQKGMRG